MAYIRDNRALLKIRAGLLHFPFNTGFHGPHQIRDVAGQLVAFLKCRYGGIDRATTAVADTMINLVPSTAAPNSKLQDPRSLRNCLQREQQTNLLVLDQKPARVRSELRSLKLLQREPDQVPGSRVRRRNPVRAAGSPHSAHCPRSIVQRCIRRVGGRHGLSSSDTPDERNCCECSAPQQQRPTAGTCLRTKIAHRISFPVFTNLLCSPRLHSLRASEMVVL